MPMFEQNLKNWYFQSLFDPFAHFVGLNGSKWPKIIFSWILRPNDFQRGVARLCLNKTWKYGIFGPFWSFLAHFLVQMCRNGPKLFFSEFCGQMISNEGSYAYVWRKLQKWYFRSLFDLFWPIFWSKWVKMTQSYFFLNSEAKRFPTRGHMPMFG